MDYQILSKKAKKVMFITAALQAVISAAVAAVVIGNMFAYTTIGWALIAAVVLLALVYIVAVPSVRFRRYRYLITADRIEIIEGVFFVSRTLVPIDRIHQINVSRGPLDSAFGVAKVSVITAGATATFRFLEEEKADEIALNLNTRIKEKLGGTNNAE